MSSEIFYSPKIEAERYAQLVAFWDEKLEQILEKKRKHKQMLETEATIDEVKLTVPSAAYHQVIINDSELQQYGSRDAKRVSPNGKAKKVFEVLKKNLRYGIDDLVEIRVVHKADALSKRNLLYELNNPQKGMDADDASAVIEKFIKQTEIALDEKRSFIDKYEEYLKLLGQDVGEGRSYDEAKERMAMVKQQFYEKKEKEYISESINNVMQKKGLYHMDMTKSSNQKHSERYCVKGDKDSVVEIVDIGINRFVLDYIGISQSGQFLSDDQKREHVKKSKQMCSVFEDIIEELRIEYGIELFVYDMLEPKVENIKIDDSFFKEESASSSAENGQMKRVNQS